MWRAGLLRARARRAMQRRAHEHALVLEPAREADVVEQLGRRDAEPVEELAQQLSDRAAAARAVDPGGRVAPGAALVEVADARGVLAALRPRRLEDGVAGQEVSVDDAPAHDAHRLAAAARQDVACVGDGVVLALAHALDRPAPGAADADLEDEGPFRHRAKRRGVPAPARRGSVSRARRRASSSP
jgi:hypothetical protein